MITGPHSIILDSEALSLVAADAASARAWMAVAVRTDSVLYASAATLAEVTDGSGRDALIRRATAFVRIEPVTADTGFQAGRLRAAAKNSRKKARDLTVDAIVAATALALPTPVVVVTSDPGDLELLLATTTVKVMPI